MPDDDQPAAPAPNVVPFPAKAARLRSATAPDTGDAAAALTIAARGLERALERQRAALHDWCKTIGNLIRTADTLADSLCALHAQRQPTAPAKGDQSTADEP